MGGVGTNSEVFCSPGGMDIRVISMPFSPWALGNTDFQQVQQG